MDGNDPNLKVHNRDNFITKNIKMNFAPFRNDTDNSFKYF